MNILRNTTELNHYLIQNYCSKDKVAIDATCGNGNDSLFLAQNCKFVTCFDIQKLAIENTTNLLKENGLDNFKCICDNNANLKNYINDKVDIIVYNLGYLPTGDKSITTDCKNTLDSLKNALTILNKDGIISILMYWGHNKGKEEREAILEFVKGLDKKDYHVGYMSFPNQDNTPPEIILITRK